MTVRALVRNPQRAAQLQEAGVHLIPGDLADNDALRQLLDGAVAVVHCAGAVRGNNQADFDKANVVGTAALLQALDDLEQVPRLCLLSSIVAREPRLSWYSRSKWQGESLLTSRNDIDWVVLRPPAVYGPGDTEMLPIFQAMKRGLATVPGSLEARNSLIHVSDLVSAIILCLESPLSRHEVLELHDGHEGGYSWPELADIVGRHVSRQVRLWRVPSRLLNLVAVLSLILGRLARRPAMLTPLKLRELRHPDWVADNGPITACSGWQPHVDLARGLAGLEL